MYSYTLSLTSALGGDEWSSPSPGSFTPGKDPVPIVWEAGWATEPVWTGAKYLAPTGIRSPNRPAHSESLYRLKLNPLILWPRLCLLYHHQIMMMMMMIKAIMKHGYEAPLKWLLEANCVTCRNTCLSYRTAIPRYCVAPQCVTCGPVQLRHFCTHILTTLRANSSVTWKLCIMPQTCSPSQASHSSRYLRRVGKLSFLPHHVHFTPS